MAGPVEGKTSSYVREARQIAAQLRSYGAGVREIYSPNATWSRVSEAARGANLLVYMGHGRGYPSLGGVFNPRTMNGLGLNRTLASGHANVRYYGEYYIRSLRLAPGAVVILNRVPYAAGSSEPGHAYPARSTATKRADNYAAGFLGAGAAVVFASDRSVVSIVRDLFGASRTMQGVFWRSPSTSTRYDSTFTSTRTSGSSGVLASDSSGKYYESVVGRLQWTTNDWQQTPSSPTVRVTSIPALLTALANDAVTEIVVANGTYRVSRAASKRSDSLWIGARFAGRTLPVLVRAETNGGVTFDGGGATYWGGITFAEGAHHQTWQGFKFTNGHPTGTGLIVFGGYSLRAAPHHITLRNIEISGLTSTTAGWGYAVYSSMSAAPGPHDILFEDFTSIDTGQLRGHFHWYHDYLDAEHSPAGNYNAQNNVVRRAHLWGPTVKVAGVVESAAIYIWASTLNNLLIEDSDIHNAAGNVIRYEGGTNIVLRRVVSTGTGDQPFSSSKGANPPGVTFDSCSLR